jgi:hypothetical protein
MSALDGATLEPRGLLSLAGAHLGAAVDPMTGRLYVSLWGGAGVSVIDPPSDAFPADVLSNYDITYNTAPFDITKKALTVTARNQSKIYGDTLIFTGTQFTTSGLVEGDAVVSVTLTSAGAAATATVTGSPYTIQASAANGTGLDNYAISYVDGELTIAPRSATVAADAKSKTYGEANPALTATVIGTVNGDTLTYTLDTTATPRSAVGSYPITVTPGANPNYDVTKIDGSLTVTARPIIVTADGKSKIYGESDPTFTYRLTGGSLVDAEDLTGALARVAGENVGTYAVQQGSLTAGGNYNLTYIGANLAIDPRAVSVTTTNAAKTYGDPDPIPMTRADLSGFLSGDGITASFTRTSGETVLNGPYHITTVLADPNDRLRNYTVTNAGATFTITKKDASAVPNPASKTYGTADPILTGTLTGFLPADGVTASFSRVAGETVPGSPYTITATLSPAGVLGNYSIAYATAPFTILKATAIVTLSNLVKAYTGAVSTPTAATNPPGLAITWTNAPQTAAGVYDVTATVVDPNYQGSASDLFIIYNASAGQVTGSGWINSPGGALTGSSATGTANFQSMSAYYASSTATIPSGSTQFTFSNGGLTFASSSYKWLAVSGSKAWWRGSGSVIVNGTSAPCEFLVAVVDGGTTTDKFRIKIWKNTPTGPQAVYDNQSTATGATALQAADSAEALRPVGATSGMTSVVVGAGGPKR